MNLVDKIRRWATTKTSTMADWWLKGWNGLGGGSRARMSMDDAYENHVWVYTAVNRISQNIGQAPFILKKKDQLITSGASFDLFRTVNPIMSEFQLWQATDIHLEVEGECMWWLDFGPGARFPQAIWIFSASRWQDVRSRDGRTIEKWNLTAPDGGGASRRYEIPADQVIHFKLYNRKDPLRGLSPLSAARLAVESDVSADEYNQAFFDNDAEGGAIFSTDKDMKQPQIDLLTKIWSERHQGPRNRSRPAWLTNGLKYEPPRIAQRDMQFIEQKNIHVEEIAAIYGVPLELLGKGQTTFSNRREAKRAFWQETIIPRLKLIQLQLKTDFFPKFDPKLEGLFDLTAIEALQEDLKDKIETGNRMFIMGWPLNAINDRLNIGMEPVPWGNDWLVDPFRVPASSLIGRSPSEAAPAPSPKSSIGLLEIPEANEAALTIMRDLVLDKQSEIFIKAITPVEKRGRDKLARMWFEQRSRVLNGLAELADAAGLSAADLVSRILNVKREAKNVLAVLQPIWIDAALSGIRAIKPAKKDAADDFVKNDSRIVAYLKKKAAERPANLMSTTRRSLVEDLAVGLEAGESIGELADRVRAIYNEAKNFSASVSRTETVEAANEGRVDFMRAEGFAKHRWVTALDEHVRESHQALEGKVEMIGDEFSNGLAFPGDSAGDPAEYYNCRCTTIPVEA